jgi:hypothetical protein
MRKEIFPWDIQNPKPIAVSSFRLFAFHHS